MSGQLQRYLDAFGGKRVVVIGEAMLDSYIDGRASRISPEAPVPVIDVQPRQSFPGGAANVAANLAALGADVELHSVVGEDEPGRELIALLAGCGVDTNFVIAATNRATLTKVRVNADGQLLLRLDDGSTEALPVEVAQELTTGLQRSIDASRPDAIVISDYGYGVMAPAVRAELAAMPRHQRPPLAIDAKDLRTYRALQPSFVKPNYQQALEILGNCLPAKGGDRFDQIAGSRFDLRECCGAEIVAVTLDADGALVFGPTGSIHRTYAAAASGSPAGAGDSFLAACILALVSGANEADAADLGTAAASTVVNQRYTNVCDIGALRRCISSQRPSIVSLEEAATLAGITRRDGKRVVFTNGCFDLVHSGHISLLKRAKALGDLLIVGVNSDASVRRLKGSGRPVNVLIDRLNVLAAMTAVDLVLPFDEDTPHECIAAIRPDLFVKGGDYTVDQLPEAQLVQSLGGEVQILPYLGGRSTTGIIEQIRSTERVLLDTGG